MRTLFKNVPKYNTSFRKNSTKILFHTYIEFYIEYWNIFHDIILYTKYLSLSRIVLKPDRICWFLNPWFTRRIPRFIKDRSLIIVLVLNIVVSTKQRFVPPVLPSCLPFLVSSSFYRCFCSNVKQESAWIHRSEKLG